MRRREIPQVNIQNNQIFPTIASYRVFITEYKIDLLITPKVNKNVFKDSPKTICIVPATNSYPNKTKEQLCISDVKLFLFSPALTYNNNNDVCINLMENSTESMKYSCGEK